MLQSPVMVRNRLKSLFDINFIVTIIVVTGILLRICAFFQYNDFNPDEAHLSLHIINRDILHCFSNFEHVQFGTPVFMISTKILTKIFGISEFVFRIIPLISGIAALILAAVLSKKVIKSYFGILFTNLLFALNIPQIMYSQTFKPYTFETAIVLISLLFFIKYDFKKNINESVIKSLCKGFVSFLPMLAVTPYAAVWAASVIYSLRTGIKNLKNFIVYVMSFLVMTGIYYILLVKPASKAWDEQYPCSWDNYFFDFNIVNFFEHYIKDNFNWIFRPNEYCMLFLIPVVFGLISMIKNRNKACLLILYTVAGHFMLSVFRIYPFGERVILYAVPLLIMICGKSFDLLLEFKNKKRIINVVYTVIFICLFSMTFHSYFGIENFKEIFLQSYKNYDHDMFPVLNARKLTKYVSDNYSGETVIYPYEDEGQFKYYIKLYAPDKEIKQKRIRRTQNGIPENTDQYTEELKNELKNICDGVCTFYFIHSENEIHSFMKKDALQMLANESKKVFYHKEIGASYILKSEIYKD